MNATNQNQSVGILFERAFLKYIKDLGYHTKTTQHTNLEYIADATLRDDGRSIFLEIKSHRSFPLETTKDTFKRICEVSIKNSKPNKPKGLFHQWRRGTGICDHYFVFVGLYTKDADEHVKDVFNGDVLKNYHHYSLYWTWKGQMFWVTIPALEMFALLAKHQGSFRAFISELCELTPDRYDDGICYHSSTKYEEYNVDPRQTGQDGNYNDIGSTFDLSDCIYNYEHYQTDPSWSTEKLKKHNISIDDDLLNNIPKRLTLDNEQIQQDQEIENDLPETIEGVSLSKSDFRVIKECFLDGLDFYDTAEKIGKSRSYLQILSKNRDPKYKELIDWMNDLLEQGNQIKEERELSQDDLINIRQNKIILSLQEELAQTKSENASLKAANSLLLATSKNEPQEFKIKLVDEHNKQMRNENRELISQVSFLTKQIQSMKNQTESKKDLEEESENQGLKEEIQLLNQQINNLRQENSRQEENLVDCLKMGNRYERIIDNLMNQIEGKS